MKGTCNIPYSKDNKKQLLNAIRNIELDLSMGGSVEDVTEYLEEEFGTSPSDTLKLVTLSISENLEDDIVNLNNVTEGFLQDVNNIFTAMYNKPIFRFSLEERAFYDKVIDFFFDQNIKESVIIPNIESESLMATDTEQEAIKRELLDTAIIKVFGTSFDPSDEIIKVFGKDIRRLIIYNDLTKVVHNLSEKEVNDKIISYKSKKFKQLLNYLKSVYPDNKKLANCGSLYKNGKFNGYAYYYVLNMFDKHIKEQKELNPDILYKQFEEFNLGNQNDVSVNNYIRLIKELKQDPDLKKWFDNKFNSQNKKNYVENNLYIIHNQIADHYYTIKEKILSLYTAKASGTNYDSDENKRLKIFEELFDLIEHYDKKLIDYTLDYMALTLFDNLLDFNLGKQIKINRGFDKGAEPFSINALKYVLKQDHRHLKAGYESGNYEGSDKHTSATVTDILDTIYIHKYDSLKPLPSTLELTPLILAWQSLYQDVVNDNIKFDDRDHEVRKVLKNMFNRYGNNVMLYTSEILEILFKEGKIPKMGRMIDRINTSKLFNEDHKNILYSFYTYVLDQSNSNSILSAELKSGKYLAISNSLVSLLYRNVDNKFINTDLRPSASLNFSISDKFNWDRELFDLVSRITLNSYTRQNIGSTWDASGYSKQLADNSTSEYISKFTLEDYDDNGNLHTYSLGLKYKHGLKNIYGLFTYENVLEDSSSRFNVTNSKGEVLEVSLLLILSLVNLKDFKNKYLKEKDLLDNNQNSTVSFNTEERLLKELFKILDYYLDLNILSEEGLDSMIYYQRDYKANPKNKLYSANYLNHFLKLALRAAEIENEVNLSNGEDIKKYLQNSEYKLLFNFELKNPSKSNVFDIYPDKVYFKPVTLKDPALSTFARNTVIVNGRSIRSTIRDKLGNQLANFNVSRAGSEVNRRILDVIDNPNRNAALKHSLFAQNPTLIDPTPIIDNEITTLIGEVKSVRDMSTGELFLHALLDKFYGSFIRDGRVAFLPTVYSDKTTFLNYLAGLTIFAKGDDSTGLSVMDLSKDFESTFIDLYLNTFFRVHNKMAINIETKLGNLLSFAGFSGTVREFLQSHTKESLNNLVLNYNKKYPLAKIELELHKDYVIREKTVLGKKIKYCDVNEVIYYYSDLYSDKEKLKNYINKLKKLFKLHLSKYNVDFIAFEDNYLLNSWVNNQEIKNPNYLLKVLSDEKLGLITKQLRELFVKDWVNENTGELILNKGDKLNPFLERFFYIEGIYSNNFRLLLSGSEVNHPDKSRVNLFNQVMEIISNYDESNLATLESNKLSLKDLLAVNNIVVENVDNISKILSNFNNIEDLRLYLSLNQDPILLLIYDESIVAIINSIEGTQFKRNNIITATLQHCTSGLIHGVSDEVEVCVIDDMPAPVNNLRKSDKPIDSQDGSAWMSSVQARLENNSLDEQRVGVNRKPIWDDLTEEGTSFQAKFAAYSQTNALMVQSLGSPSALHVMFKKMHNLRWNGLIDITKSIYNLSTTKYVLTNVSNWFKTKILQNKLLFYKNLSDLTVEIVDFGHDEKGYFTVEQVYGSSILNTVYHYYDEDSNHYTLFLEGLHTIDSLYELFVAMGGIYSVSKDGVVSEMSQDVLTNFVINVGHKRVFYKNKSNQVVELLPGQAITDEIRKNIVENNPKYSSDVVQPLKSKFIAYAFNNTAVKNGAKNINSHKAWTDSSIELNTFKVRTRGLGILLNADHDVVNSTITEFSQVIAACIAYGKDFNSSKEIYYSLGKSAAQASRRELAAIELYLKYSKVDFNKARFLLYTIIGKLIVDSRSNNNLDLTNSVKRQIKQLLEVNTDNFDAGLKMPFSDPSIYTLFITNITSIINKKSIKRPHPGVAYVMVPGYNVVMTYSLNHNGTYLNYLFNDVVNKAKNHYKGLLILNIIKYCETNKVLFSDLNTLKTQALDLTFNEAIQLSQELNLDNTIYSEILSLDIVLYNKLLVEKYLKYRQEKEVFRSKDWFMPTDIVEVYYPDGRTSILDLSDIKDFYAFKDRPEVPGTKFKLCITRPNNLKPSLIRWRYYEPTSLEDLGIVKGEEYSKPWKTDASKTNPAFRLMLKEDLERSFEIVKDRESKYWSIHFKTLKEGEIYDKNNLPITEELKVRLFKAAAAMIPEGEYLSTWGTVTKGGFRGLDRFYELGFELVGSRKVENNIVPIFKKVGKYMSIYDHPIIKESIKHSLNQGELTHTQADVLNILDNLANNGEFSLDEKTNIKIVEGSLENTEALLIAGNMYKDVFGLENEFLVEILEKGEKFFKDKTEYPEVPDGNYDLALIKKSGNHALITLGRVQEGINVFDSSFENEYVDEKSGEIYTYGEPETESNKNNKNRLGVKIGKYVSEPTWRSEDGKTVLDENDNTIPEGLYLIIYDNDLKIIGVKRRIDFVKKYRYIKEKSLVNGQLQSAVFDLYKIDIDNMRSAFGGENSWEDACKLASRIISKLYKEDNYVNVLLNDKRGYNNEKLISNVLSDLGLFGTYEDGKWKKFTEEEILKLPPFLLHMIEVRNLLLSGFNRAKYNRLKTNYYKNRSDYKLKYASFLNSLHFISSRIPAQTLQSFMAMRLVGWTGNTDNTAYVSYILTYLLGSDYDIDKAYIMGQSFNDDGIYIGWSPLFNRTNFAMLQASKTLPLPRGLELKVSKLSPAYNIDNELDLVLNSTGATKIRNLAKLIRKITSNNGFYDYTNVTDLKLKILNKIQEHEYYEIPEKYANLAYKNVASANIYNISHNIRNRDLAYTAVTMEDLLRLASESPKGKDTRALNMVNPFTKYIMQSQNLIGKGVIGIAANGEKDWFNITYYYHELLRSGKNLQNLSMAKKYTRIHGRANDQITSVTIKHIPDLWHATEELKLKLKDQFYQTLEDKDIDMNDKYVDLLISLLLSSATDNAKELILARINGGTNLARYYIHLIIMGFKLDDIVAYMTSPVIELIDKYSTNDLYQKKSSNVGGAIKVLKGDINISTMLSDIDDLSGLSDEVRISMEQAIELLEEAQEQLEELLEAAGIKPPKKKDTAYSYVTNTIKGLYNASEATSLKEFVKFFITAQYLNEDSGKFVKILKGKTLPTDTGNMKVNQFFRYLNKIKNDINSEISAYNSNNPSKSAYEAYDFLMDFNEFQKLNYDADETSKLASVWLKLNQGIPQTDIELIKLMRNMRGSVSSRERAIGISKPSDVDINLEIQIEEDKELVEDLAISDKKIKKLDLIDAFTNIHYISPIARNLPEHKNAYLSTINKPEYKLAYKVIDSILANNSDIQVDLIKSVMIDALNSGIYGNFDLHAYLEDKDVKVPISDTIYSTRKGDTVSYRELAATYYNMIKATWNILDIVNTIPHYKENLNLLNYTLTLRNLFSNKAKIVDSLIQIGELNYSISDLDYRKIALYADKIIINSYFLQKTTPIMVNKINTWLLKLDKENKLQQFVHVYNPDYVLKQSEEIYLNTLNGIDSLKYFVETYFLDWLKKNYPNNEVVKALVSDRYFGKNIIRTRLNLLEVENSIANKRTYFRYLLAMEELKKPNSFNDEYSIADILAMYNLAINGTKLGGKFLTALFKNSIVEDFELYDYFKTIGDYDFKLDMSYMLPSKKDFLIWIAPTVYSQNHLIYRTEPYVKVVDVNLGYKVFKKFYNKNTHNYEYSEVLLLKIYDTSLTEDLRNSVLFNYTLNAISIMPSVHNRIRENNIFNNINSDKFVKEIADMLVLYSRSNRLIIHERCE